VSSQASSQAIARRSKRKLILIIAPLLGVVATIVPLGPVLSTPSALATTPPSSTLADGASLTTATGNNELLSPSGNYELLVQTDGNVVVYQVAGMVVKWSTGTTASPPGYRLALQSDGNLVVSSSGGTTRWYSGTAGTSATDLVMQDDGNLVIYGINGPTWSWMNGQILTSVAGSYSPTKASELWGGQSTAESCSSCAPDGLKTPPGGKSTQGSQPVGTVLGDYTTSQDLFNVPTIDGSLSLNLRYDSGLAANQKQNSTTPVGFGYGWSSSMSNSVSVSGSNISVNDGTTAQALFTLDSGGATCPAGDNTSYLKYTAPSSSEDYCASNRTNAQLMHNDTYGFYDFQVGGGRSVAIYSAYGQLASQGNLANSSAITWNQNVSPGSGTCPTGWGGICITATDVAARVMTAKVVYGLVFQVNDPLGRVYSTTYDSNINLSTITSPAPASSGTVTTTFGYSAAASPYNADLTSITDPLSHVQHINYSSTGMVSSLVDPLNSNTTSYSYANTTCASTTGTCASGAQATTVTYPDGEIDVDGFTGSQLTTAQFGASATPGASDTESWTFDYVEPTSSNQNASIIKDVLEPNASTGVASSFAAIIVTDAVGNVTSYTDPSGNVTTSMYNDVGANNLNELCWTTAPGVSVASATCSAPPTGSTSFTYNSFGDVLAQTDPLGNVSHNAYSTTTGLRCWSAPPAVSTSSSSCSSVPTGATSYTYGASWGNLNSTTVGVSTSQAATTTNQYNADDQVICTLPPAGQSGNACGAGANSYETTFTFYADGSPNVTSAPLSATTSYLYDNAGHQLRVTTATNVTTDTYDADGRKCWTLVAASASSNGCASAPSGSTTYSYLADTSSPTVVTDPSGSATMSTYSDKRYPSQATQVAQAAGSTYFNFDNLGNTCVSGPSSLGSPGTSTSCPSSSTGYTANVVNNLNQTLSTTDADGHLTTNYYDSIGRKIATTGPSGTPSTCDPTTSSTPCPDTTKYSYDSLSQLTCVGEPNSANNTCSSIGSGAGLTQFTYTADGKRASMIDSSGTTSYTYDSLDQLTSTTNGVGATTTYTYNTSSDQTCISYPNSANNTCQSKGSGAGIASYTYDAANQLATMTDWVGNSLAYTYNSSGSQTNLSANSGAVQVADTYDAAGGVMAIHATASSGSVNLLGLAVTRTTNESIASVTPTVGTTAMNADSFTYNSSNQVATGPINAPSGSNNYGYTASGGITQATNQFASAAYDSAGVLCWTLPTTSSNVCGSPPTGSTAFTTNTDGGRTSMTPASGNPSSYAWDTTLGTLNCANVNGTTCSTSSPTASTTIYGYNGDGLRVNSTIVSTTTQYTWDTSTGTQRIISDGTWDYIYSPGGNVPIEQVAASGSSPIAEFLVVDANNSVRGIVQLSPGTHQNQLVNYTDYDAYGNPITQSGGTTETGGMTVPQIVISSNYIAASPFGFGEGYSDTTGLIYLVHRYFDPSSAQFISIDPEVNSTLQPFAYSSDNPVNLSDPTGMDLCERVVAQYFHHSGNDISIHTTAICPSGMLAGLEWISIFGPSGSRESRGVFRGACVGGLPKVGYTKWEFACHRPWAGPGWYHAHIVIVLRVGSTWPYADGWSSNYVND